MFTNVLVGVDGRQGGRDAIALAQQLAGADATFTLAHVCAPFPGRGAMEVVQIDRAESHRMLERERELAAVEAQLVVRGPRPVGRGLHEVAEELRVDLLVVGSTRHAVVGRVLMGDDCRAVLDGAPCAIGVAPCGYDLLRHELTRVGVGYNASPGSAQALTTARELATARGGTVKAFWVVSPQEVREDKPIPADWPDAIDELVKSHSEELAQLDGIEGVVTYGGPREELGQAGQGVDLLVIGSRGDGPIGRLFHGSVSRYLVRHATCPLLVLPRRALTEREQMGDREVGVPASSGG